MIGRIFLRTCGLVAAAIAAEKTLPWRRPVTAVTALALIVLGLLMVVSPETIPALTIPGHGMPMDEMGG